MKSRQVLLSAFSVLGSGRLSLDAWLAKRYAELQGNVESAPGESAIEETDEEHAQAHP